MSGSQSKLKSFFVFGAGAALGAAIMFGVYYKMLRTDPAHFAKVCEQEKSRLRATLTAEKEAPKLDEQAALRRCERKLKSCSAGELTAEGNAPEPEEGPEDVRTFVFQPGPLTSVSFLSKAPLEDILGTNQGVSGKVVVDLNNPTNKAQGKITVDVSQFKTGIELRDEHLRNETWLNTKAHPAATFEIEKIETKQRLAVGYTTVGTVHGAFTMMGKTSKVKVPIKAAYVEATKELQETAYIKSNLLVIDGSFRINLKEYGVKGLKDLGGKKVSESVLVTLKLAGAEQ